MRTCSRGAGGRGDGRGGKGETRRGGKGKHKTTSLVIMNNNVCGYNSKKSSFKNIMTTLSPDIVTLQETNVSGSNRINIDKRYFTSLRNRKTAQKMGGVATAVANSLKNNTVKVGEGQNEDEYLITRVDHIYPPINVINVYEGQESRMTTKEVFDSWMRLKKDVDQILQRKEGVILIGDFNVSLGNDDHGIKGNHGKVSYRGKLIREMLEEKEIFLINGMELVENGPWTWESRSDPSKKSCLDLVMASENLMPYISSMLVDTKREYAPCRVAKKKGGCPWSTQITIQ